MDINLIQNDFPILKREIRPGKKLVYLDSAATSQKPSVVLEAMDHYYQYSNANIHRGVHTLAEEATASYELARKQIGKFINAAHSYEIIFVRNTTEAINLVAYAWARHNLSQGDVVILTEMEHHSNLVPWQILTQERGIRLEFIPVTDEGILDLDTFHNLLNLGPKLVSFTHVSNVLGTINPAREMISAAHQAGAITLVDAAQSVPHFSVDVQDLDADFLAFSAHKMLGPTAIGVLYGKESILDKMPPAFGGGDMIKRVYLRSFTPNDLPHKFEAGTPAIAEAIGFGAAVNYLQNVGMDNIAAYESHMTAYGLKSLSGIAGIQVIGPQAHKKGAVLSFTMEGIHPHDIAQILDCEGIAVRAGHHCAMPLHDKLNLTATTRASFYCYNTTDEIDSLVNGLEKVQRIFG